MAAIDSHEFRRRRRAKNVGLALALLALVVLFFLLTIVKMGGASP